MAKLRHSVLVLLVLIILELELLDLTLSLLVSFHIFSSMSLNVSKFNFQLSNTGLELSHSILATTHGTLICISQIIFHFCHLSLESSLRLRLSRDMVLFRSKLISKTSSINHSLFGLLLRVLSLMKHVVNFSLKGVQSA